MNPKRILLADDEVHICRVLELFLRREGYAVEVVRDGQAALDSILRHPPDVLLTDIEMPRMTGKTLCLELDQLLPQREFRIIVMTSMTEREHQDWAKKMRNTLFLEKPVSARLLISMLARYFSNDGAEGSLSDA